MILGWMRKNLACITGFMKVLVARAQGKTEMSSKATQSPCRVIAKIFNGGTSYKSHIIHGNISLCVPRDNICPVNVVDTNVVAD